MHYPRSLENLIVSFKNLPGVGEKTAERLAFSILEFDEEKAKKFSQSILEVKSKIKKCNICNSLTENDICDICSNDYRDKKILCVVEDSKNVFLMEKMGSYNGIYYVLGGLISPLDGIGPDELKIYDLINRIKKEKIEEVIIVVKPSIEGETTSLYISKLLENEKVKVSKIAYGIPLGADIDFVDIFTLERALEDRKEI